MKGRPCKLYDCGTHGRLTAAQIAAHAGIKMTSVYNRISQGVKGEALVAAPLSAAERFQKRTCENWHDREVHTGGRVLAYIAAKISRKFPSCAPTAAELRAGMGMSRATAYRWAAAFKDAYCEAPAVRTENKTARKPAPSAPQPTTENPA